MYLRAYIRFILMLHSVVSEFKWIKKAGRKCDEWAKVSFPSIFPFVNLQNNLLQLQPAGHRAVMKKNGKFPLSTSAEFVLILEGTHGTKKVKPQDWNSELFEFVSADLDQPFKLLINVRCNDISRAIAERVGDTVDRLNTTLNGNF